MEKQGQGQAMAHKTEQCMDKYVRFDWAIKGILRDKKNFDVLEGFLTVFLDEKIEILEILEGEGNQESEDDKLNRVDIMAKNSKGEIIAIEVQNARDSFMLERLIFVYSKVIVDNMSLGMEYRNVKKVYCIAVLHNNNCGGNAPIYHSVPKIVNELGEEFSVRRGPQGQRETKHYRDFAPEIIILDLACPKWDQTNYVEKREWLNFLKNGEIADRTSVPGLETARQKLLRMSMDKKDRDCYDRYMMERTRINGVILTYIEDEVERKAVAFAEEKKKLEEEKKLERTAREKAEAEIEKMKQEKALVVKSLYLAHFPISEIGRMTGLSEAEVEEIVHTLVP